jgi:hypothetical protein
VFPSYFYFLFCFSLFIGDIMCADDLQIYHNRPRGMLSECIREVNSDMRKILSGLVLIFADLQEIFIGSSW